MPSMVDAVVLLGWMEKDFAIKYLVEECVFGEQLTETQAEDIWSRYRDRVQAIPERDVRCPERLALSDEERRKAGAFLKFHGIPQRPGPIREVIKINPMELVTHQPYICLDRVAEHLVGGDGCDSLSTVVRAHQLTIYSSINFVRFNVPHGEFAFFFDQQSGQFAVSETARHVSVTEFQNRMILWAGYHRSYACMVRENPDGIDRSMLVALTTDADFFVSEQSPNQGLRATVCGLRPPLFRDFFDERFFIKVKLRKKRYELQIRAQTVGVNID
jgi:hypothetical protein